MPLNKEICKRCWLSRPTNRWHAFHEDLWENGRRVPCGPKQDWQSALIIRIDEPPPFECPYSAEQTVSQGDKPC